MLLSRTQEGSTLETLETAVSAVGGRRGVGSDRRTRARHAQRRHANLPRGISGVVDPGRRGWRQSISRIRLGCWQVVSPRCGRERQERSKDPVAPQSAMLQRLATLAEQQAKRIRHFSDSMAAEWATTLPAWTEREREFKQMDGSAITRQD